MLEIKDLHVRIAEDETEIVEAETESDDLVEDDDGDLEA